MKSFTLSLIVLSFFLFACGTTGTQNINKDDPEYQQGYALGVQTANEDKGKIKCSNGAVGLRWARTRMNKLEEEGRSKIFQSGFYRGYVTTWDNNMDVICL